MVEKGLHFHVTTKGTIMVVATDGDDSIVFQPTLGQFKQIRDEANRTISQLEKQHQ